ncbi:F-box protein At4g22280-like [Trifolium pratense]|uniref:F-box protein At4g22280-like n=1 Tax=Trifolium pratense TaxID=57577 RepID=UPI001E693782|nr:F-box protein At4g22280-like [Trifolium pratense]
MSSLAHEKMIPPDNKRGRRDNNEDRLSDLPDCVLLHILSFLNSKHAVQTCVLSPRWKHLWKCIPTLILHSSEFSNAKKLGIFVTKILNLRDTTPSLHTLDFERLGSFEPQRTLKEIINYACSHNTQLKKLGICVKGDSSIIFPRISSCISSCQALTSLKLYIYPKGLYSNGKRTLFPKYLNLPALTSLDLTYFTFCASDNADHAEPFSSFNCLNNLIISSCTVTDTPILRISSATLVNLTMSYNSSDFPKFELFAPSLYTITFEGVPHQRLCGSSLSSIKQVNIEADIFSNRFEELPFVLFSWQQDLINIKSLTVAATDLKILSLVPDLFKAKLPSLLCNLKTLKVCSRLTWLTKIRLTFDKSSNEDTVEKSQANTRSLPQDNGL